MPATGTNASLTTKGQLVEMSSDHLSVPSEEVALHSGLIPRPFREGVRLTPHFPGRTKDLQTPAAAQLCHPPLISTRSRTARCAGNFEEDRVLPLGGN